MTKHFNYKYLQDTYKVKILKSITIIIPVLLVFQMCAVSVFFVHINLVKAQVQVPYIDTAKSAVSNKCEEAEITLKITSSGEPIQQRKPIDVVFVIDRSSSMSGVYLNNVKSAVNDFIDNMEFSVADPDRVGVVSYAGYNTDASQINYSLGSDGASAKSAVNSIVAGGGTCIECGLNDAYGMLGSGTRDQFVILLSDGVANVKIPGDYNNINVCNYGTTYMDCPVTASLCMNNAVDKGESIKNDLKASIYSIGYRLGDIDNVCVNEGQTSGLATQTLKNISSGNGYYFSGDPSDINNVFDSIAWKINNVAAYSSKIVEVLPNGISYVSMISGPDPDSVVGQTITWDFGKIEINQIKEVVFLVKTSSTGFSGLIDVYPDTRVEYLDYLDNLHEKPFPETSLNIASCNPVEAKSSIAGYKYQDFDNNVASSSDWVGIGDWTIEIFDTTASSSMQATTSDTGYFEFKNLKNGIYTLTEIMKSGWTQLLAPNNNIVITGTSSFDNIFVNYFGICGNNIIDTNEVCDDGNVINGDGCDSTCNTESNGGGVSCGDGVINQSSEECDGTDGLTAGYSCTNLCKLQKENNNGGGGGGGGISYYPAPQYPAQTENKTNEVEEVKVLGETGAPELVITKTVNKEFANPGDENIEYTIKVVNNGKLTAFNTILKDILPAGLVYQDDNKSEREWLIGDLAVGIVKEFKYKVKTAKTADAKKYVNTATVKADNNAEVSASATIEVRKIQVLAETGFVNSEFIALIILFAIFSGSVLYLRKKNQ